MTEQQPAFWRTKAMEQMTQEEWESLCDGCGRCCLNKVIDADTDTIHTVSVACKLLDLKTGRCTNYKHRRKQVSDCIKFTPKTMHEHLKWLPDGCAYRLIYDGFDLPDWHPLITGDPESVYQAGFSVRDKDMISEEDMTDPSEWFDRIIYVG